MKRYGNGIENSAYDDLRELCLHCEHAAMCAYTDTERTPATRAFACTVTLLACLAYDLEWQDGELIWTRNTARKHAVQTLAYEPMASLYTATTKEEHTAETKRLILEAAKELQALFPKTETKELRKTETTRLNGLFANTAMQNDFEAESTI